MTDNRRATVVQQETMYQGYVQIDRYRLRHTLFRGGDGPILTREIVRRGDVAAVIPVDPERDQVVLIEQFRPGAMAAGWDAWLVECVAGIIDPGENAADVARREAAEEAGCDVTELIPAARFLTTPGVSTETVELFCGRTEAAGVGGIHGLDHEGEDIRAVALPLDEAIDLLARGRIVNAITLVAMQWLSLHYAAVKAQWT